MLTFYDVVWGGMKCCVFLHLLLLVSDVCYFPFFVCNVKEIYFIGFFLYVTK
jgi:hypothetical protein